MKQAIDRSATREQGLIAAPFFYSKKMCRLCGGVDYMAALV
jgi:hypothetical protein